MNYFTSWLTHTFASPKGASSINSRPQQAIHADKINEFIKIDTILYVTISRQNAKVKKNV